MLESLPRRGGRDQRFFLAGRRVFVFFTLRLLREEDVDLADRAGLALEVFPFEKDRRAEPRKFRAARRAASLPPKTESLNIFVTAVTPRRKWT